MVNAVCFLVQLLLFYRVHTYIVTEPNYVLYVCMYVHTVCSFMTFHMLYEVK
jgi:hypothetical protein